MEQSEEKIVRSKFKIGLVGIGQGGSSLAQSLAKTINGLGLGFDMNHLVSINLSEADLISATLVPKDNRIRLDKRMYGAGKNRDTSKTYIMEKREFILNRLSEVYKTDVNLIFVIYSLDGGTGSGIGPYLTALLESNAFVKSHDCMVMGIPILPDQNAGKLGLSNTIEALKEISNLSKNKVARFMLVDNNTSENSDPTVRWEEINHSVVNMINRYLFTTYLSSSSNLDFEDRFVSLKIPGCHTLLSYNRAKDGIKIVSPFVLPEGARVDRMASEIPLGSSDVRNSVCSYIGCVVDEPNMIGFYDSNNAADKATPIIHLAGFSNLAVITEKYQSWFAQIKQKSEKAAQVDQSKGSGFDSIKENKEWIESESTTNSDIGADDLFSMLGN